jgi:RHS repeat-associated protein
VHAPGSFEPILQQQNGEVFLCVNDHLGMPKDLVAADGAVAWSATHAAYGRIVATYVDDTARARYGTAINSPFRLLGQVADEDAELCFTRFRCFDPEIGSWISSDPLELEGGLNLYGFDGAPTDVVDPLGLAGSKHDDGAEATVRVRHFTNSKGVKGIENKGIITASDQNKVFTVKAQGKPGSPRDVEEALGIKRGRGNNYVEFDAKPGEFQTVKNARTGATETVFDGDVDLAGRNATFHRNR